MKTKLISFICPSRNLNIIRSFLDNIELTVRNPELVECLFKVDEDDPEAKRFMETEVNKRPFSVKYIITSRLNGIYSVWLACNELFTLTSPDSYFVHVISDEVRFETKHWDDILKDYIGHFPDHVFRLRMSTFMLNTYPDSFLCNLTPDSFPIYTRKWIELTLGLGTHSWASDIFNQMIAYHLSLGEQGYKYFNTPYYDKGIFRDVQLKEIKLSGLEFGVGVSHEIMKNRALWITQLWNRNQSHSQQEYFSYLAKRLSSYIWAKANHVENFRIYRSKLNKKVQIINEQGIVLREVAYGLPRIKHYFANAVRRVKVARVLLAGWCDIKTAKYRNGILRLMNVMLDKLYAYKALRFVNLLACLPLPRFMKSYLNQLKELDQQMPVAKYGRIQKNTIFFYLACTGLIGNVIDSINKFIVGPPPGLSDKKSLFGRLFGSRWPRAMIKIPENDRKWALIALNKHKEIFAEMENSVQAKPAVKAKQVIEEVDVINECGTH